MTENNSVNATENTNANGQSNGLSEQPDLDQFGRDAAERTVELTPEVAELVSREVELGKHQTFDDALTHLVARGVAEQKRIRDNAEKLRAAKQLQREKDSFSELLSQYPHLATDPAFVSKMIATFATKAKK